MDLKIRVGTLYSFNNYTYVWLPCAKPMAFLCTHLKLDFNRVRSDVVVKYLFCPSISFEDKREERWRFVRIEQSRAIGKSFGMSGEVTYNQNLNLREMGPDKYEESIL